MAKSFPWLALGNTSFQYRLAFKALAAIFTVAILSFCVKLFRWRFYVRKLRAHGLPMPPHNPLLGHLPIAARIASRLPSNAHSHYLTDQIRREYPELGPNYYLDLFPMAPSMLVLASPDTLYQVTQEHSLPKFPTLQKFLKPLTDGLDIVTMEGQVWKKWRKVFNPGFSAAHLMTLVPLIVKETETFAAILQGHERRGDMVRMKDLTDNLTMDVIGRVVLDTHLNCQRAPNHLVNGLRTQIRWLSFGAEPNLFTRYNPLRPLVHWHYSRQVNAYVSKELNQRLESFRQESKPTNGTHTIMDLALGTYFSEPQPSTEKPDLDPFFRQICMAQIKIFLFSGHDTTSSSICYVLYLLSIHREALSQIRDEHTKIFSAKIDETARLISEDPTLLNKLPYTTAVIKESLRLFPVVSSTRIGEPGYSVRDANGHSFPTEHFLIWSNPHTIQRDRNLWPNAEDFLPRRWIVTPGDPLYPVKGAWRAFEHGPRNCIGQELAMLEIKIVLCLVVRRFQIRDCYAELDGAGLNGKAKRNMVEGERAYQVQLSQPEGDLPCRIVKAV